MTSTACDDQFAKEPDPPKTVAVCARTHTSDQVLTGNYLHGDAERLEEECRLARERGKTVCVWVKNYRQHAGHQCGCNLYEFPFIDLFDQDFKFCPFCGKTIKVKT
jgi:hypothetical protein